MQLSQAEAEHFFSLFKPLLIYTNQQFKIIKGLNQPEDIETLSLEQTAQIRNKLYEHPELFDQYIQISKQELTPEDISLIQTWKKNFLPGRFFVFRYLKKYTIFLSTEEPYKAYGVLSLYTSFREIFGSSLPTLIETVLLPFKDKIISDGIFQGSNIYFGSNYRNSLKDSYNEAKARFGIITSLRQESKEIITSDTAKLKTYLKNQYNRSLYQEEISLLKEKNEELKRLYYQEMGKINARKYTKHWRELGLTNLWFALWETVPIASGKTKSDLEKNLKQILTSEQRQLVYIFHLKDK